MPPAEPFVLLASAYDYGGAEGIAAVYRAARNDPRFRMELVAAGPALRLFRSRGWPVRPAPEERVTAFDPQLSLARFTRELLREVRPAAILTALSGSEAGIDEMLQQLAGSTPDFALQDFWGDLNLTLGRGASTYLVIDAVAAEISRARGAAATTVVGSAKHAGYAHLDAVQGRQRYRAAWRCGDADRLLVFFGQPLWAQQGYRESLVMLRQAVGRIAPDVCCLYRPHPAEAAAGFDPAAVAAMDWKIDGEGSTTDALAAADVCVSVFSSTAYDQIVLSRFSPRPLGSVVYLLCDDDLRRWVGEKTGIETFPAVSQGLALQALAADLDATLSRAFDAGLREQMWHRACEIVPDPARAPVQVLNVIAAAVAA